MVTTRNYAFPVSPFKTHWSLRTASPCQRADWIVQGRTVTFEIAFHPDMTDAQRADAVRYFEACRDTQDARATRAAFVGLFARSAHLATWDWSVAA